MGTHGRNRRVMLAIAAAVTVLAGACMQAAGAPPALQIVEPGAGAVVTATITITAATAPGTAWRRVEFRVDTRLLATDTTAPYIAAWDTRTVADGAHQLRAVGIRADGTITRSTRVRVTVANATAPTSTSTTTTTHPRPTSTSSTTTTTPTSSTSSSTTTTIAGPPTGTVFYVGPFSASAPQDQPGCGTRAAPCATLAYWNKNRRAVLRPGDTVRFAAGTYTDTGVLARAGYHCVLLDGAARGVTYEGRTASDEPAGGDSVVISLSGVSADPYAGTNPCQRRGITPTNPQRCNTDAWGTADDYSGFTVRSLTIADAADWGVYLCGSKVSQPAGIRFERARVLRTAGIVVGAFDNGYRDPDCRSTGRTVRDVTFVDVEVAGPSTGFPGGLTLACMDTATVRRAYVHDTGQTVCTNPSTSGCDDRDGINGSGGVNITVQDSTVARAGEDGVDIGGHPAGKSHDWIIERVAAHNAAGTNFKVSGGQRVTIRNSMSWGRGVGYQSYSGARYVRLVNNTFWNAHRAFMTWQYQTNSTVENNIFVTTVAEPTVWLDYATTNPTNVWRSNVVVNTAGAWGFAEYAGDAASRPACDGWNASRTVYEEWFDLSLGSNPAPIPCPLGTTANPSAVPPTPAGLATVQTAGSAGTWFGPGTAALDRWGAAPVVANPALVDSPDDLQLVATDTVARGAGLPQPDVTVDFFGRPRAAGPLNIGAT